jgi:hypothetical protein
LNRAPSGYLGGISPGNVETRQLNHPACDIEDTSPSLTIEQDRPWYQRREADISSNGKLRGQWVNPRGKQNLADRRVCKCHFELVGGAHVSRWRG